jgi:hypothetical protein
VGTDGTVLKAIGALVGLFEDALNSVNGKAQVPE